MIRIHICFEHVSNTLHFSVFRYTKFRRKLDRQTAQIGPYADAEKRDTAARRYNSVHPFDSKSLHHLLATEDITENDIKFISWESFDAALEHDNGLFDKLLSLADNQQSMPMLAQKLAQDTFVPLQMASNRGQDSYYYRITRSVNAHE